MNQTEGLSRRKTGKEWVRQNRGRSMGKPRQPIDIPGSYRGQPQEFLGRTHLPSLFPQHLLFRHIHLILSSTIRSSWQRGPMDRIGRDSGRDSQLRHVVRQRYIISGLNSNCHLGRQTVGVRIRTVSSRGFPLPPTPCAAGPPSRIL